VDLRRVPPEGIISIEDLQNAPVGARTFLYAHFTSSCLMICAGTHGYVINYGWKTRLDENKRTLGERMH
jgi:hypothetical protein